MSKERPIPEEIADVMNPGGAEREKAVEKLRADCPELDGALAKIEKGVSTSAEFMKIISDFNNSQEQSFSGMYDEYHIELDDLKFQLSVRHFQNGTIEMKGSWNG